MCQSQFPNSSHTPPSHYGGPPYLEAGCVCDLELYVTGVGGAIPLTAFEGAASQAGETC